MSIFIKISGCILIAALLSLILSKETKDFSVLLILAVCSITITVTVQYLEPVIELLKTLSSKANLDGGMLKILLKSVGIGILAEIVSLVCTDSGNATLGKTVQFSAAVMILYLSAPLFSKLIVLIEDILSAV